MQNEIPDHLPFPEAEARGLLKAKGYGMTCTSGHVHATAGGQEWHVCIVTDLSSLSHDRFLCFLEEAIERATLLHERGYGIICRFDHIHAMVGGQELHLCLTTDHITLHPGHFLRCLEEAAKWRGPSALSQR